SRVVAQEVLARGTRRAFGQRGDHADIHYGLAMYVRPGVSLIWRRFGKSETWMIPVLTRTSVPSQRSAGGQKGPPTGADAERPRLRSRPLPFPHSWRTVVVAAPDARALAFFRFGQTLKSPPARRSSTIARP